MLNKIKKILIFTFFISTVIFAFTPSEKLEKEMKGIAPKHRLNLILKFANENKINTSDEVIKYINEGIVIARQLERDNDEIDLLLHKGHKLEQHEKYEEAMKIYIDLENNYNINLEAQIALLNLYMSSIYVHWSDYPNALKATLKALNLYENSKNQERMSDCFINLGNIYSLTNKTDLALNYYNKALQIFTIMNDKDGIATVLYNVSLIQKDLGKYTDALQKIKKAKKIYEKLDIKEGIIDCLNIIGMILSEQNKLKEARSVHEKAVELAKETNNKYRIANSLENIAWLDHKEKKLKIALKSLFISLEIYKELKIKGMIMGTYLAISNVYHDSKNDEKALEFHKKYTNLYNEIFNDNNKKELAQFQSKYKISKQLREINSLKQDSEFQKVKLKNKKNKNIFLSIVIIISFAFIIILVQRFRKFKKLHKQVVLHKKKLENSYLNLKSAQNVIIDLEKRNSILAMIVTANHEINQPLTVIKGNLYLFQMSLKKVVPSKLQTKTIEKIKEAIKMMETTLHKYRQMKNYKISSYADDENVKMVVIADEETAHKTEEYTPNSNNYN